MPLSIADLRAAAGRRPPVVRSLSEAKAYGYKTAFLCHSHRDEELVTGLVHLLAESGWKVYVDWADTEMPPVPNRETAERIQQKIRDLNFFLFLATSNSMASRWCPWEIGYADGKKPIDQILVVPTRDGQTTHGNEYLELYRRVDTDALGELVVLQPGRSYGGVPLRGL